MTLTADTLPPFGDPRITYRQAHHAEDQHNLGLTMLIDGAEVWTVDYYAHSDENELDDVPTERDVYDAFCQKLQQADAADTIYQFERYFEWLLKNNSELLQEIEVVQSALSATDLATLADGVAQRLKTKILDSVE